MNSAGGSRNTPVAVPLSIAAGNLPETDDPEAVSLTFSNTVSVAGSAEIPVGWNNTAPIYVPDMRLVVLTFTCTCCGALPEVGVTESHPLPVKTEAPVTKGMLAAPIAWTFTRAAAGLAAPRTAWNVTA